MDQINYFEVLNALGDGVVCIDNTKRITYCNHKAMSILGMDIDRILLTDIEDVFNVSTVVDGSIISKLVDYVFATGKQTGLKPGSYIVNNHRAVKYLSASFSRLVADDAPPIVVINFRDITDFIRLEKQLVHQKENLQLILDSLPLGIMIVNENRTVGSYNTYINKRFKVGSIVTGDSLVGNILKCENAVDRLCGLGEQCVTCPLRFQLLDSAYNTGKYETLHKQFHHIIDDKIISCDYRISFLSIKENEMAKTLLILQDITSQIEYEETISLARKNAVEASHMKSAFIANMSHEIRTPLNGIIGMIDLTCRSLQQPELIENLEIAKSSSESLLSLINNILDLSKIEVGKMPVHQKEFFAMQIFRDVVNEYKFKAKEKNLEFTLDVSSLINIKIISDPGKIKQILINLIYNALKFTEYGYVKVEGYMSDDNLIIKVMDTGIGIDDSFKEKLFASFTQGDDTYTRRKGGTGLGLTISSQLIKLLKGRIKFESQVGKGSIFIVTIPVKRASLNVIDDIGDTPLEQIYNGQVLLAEDDVINQMVISRQLEMSGYNVTVVNNGKEAIERYNHYHFDLIIMDIQMPVMNGLEAVEFIRKQDKTTPVVALTALALKNEKEEIMSYGFDRFIAKPVDLKVLSDLVSNLISKKKFVNFEVTSKSFDVHKILSSLSKSLKVKNCKLIDQSIDLLRENFEEEHINTLLFKMKMGLRKENYEQMASYLEAITEILIE
ncbi:MAG: response regulator [Clostridiales bacterium]|nr:response regulator [Clostridiales bacterium]